MNMDKAAVILPARPSEPEHWYWPDGRPAYEIIGRNGQPRSTTLRDTKSFGLYPSVSMISRQAAKPNLEHWKAQQVLLAALTTPRVECESEQDYVERILADSREHAAQAAERGTLIHTWIQQGFEGKLLPNNEARIYYTAVHMEMLNIGMVGPWRVEHVFAHPTARYGGKVDLHRRGFVNAIGCIDDGIILDIKTKETSDKFSLYDDHYKQLAAHREGLQMPKARCGIVFVATHDEEPTVEIRWAEEKQLQRGWRMFQALLMHFYARTGLNSHD